MRLATVALLAIAATNVFAQDFGGQGPPPGGPGGFGQGGFGQGGPGGMRMGMPPAVDKLPPLVAIANRPEVAAELNLSEDQREKIDDIIQSFQESMRPQGGRGFGGPGQGGPGQGGPQGGPGQGGQRGQRGPGGEQDRAARDKAETAVDAKIKAVLNSAQAKRIGEIQIQAMGLAAAMVPAVQAKLGLSDDQKAKLKALVPARPQGGPGGPDGPGGFGPGGPGGGPGGEGFGGPPPQGDGQGFGGQGFGGPGQGGRGQGGPQGGQRGPGGDARRKELETKIAAILTSDQKAALKALGGKPFKLEMGGGRPPQGGPGGPGGPGGGPGGPGGGFGGGPFGDPRR